MTPSIREHASNQLDSFVLVTMVISRRGTLSNKAKEAKVMFKKSHETDTNRVAPESSTPISSPKTRLLMFTRAGDATYPPSDVKPPSPELKAHRDHDAIMQKSTFETSEEYKTSIKEAEIIMILQKMKEKRNIEESTPSSSFTKYTDQTNPTNDIIMKEKYPEVQLSLVPEIYEDPIKDIPEHMLTSWQLDLSQKTSTSQPTSIESQEEQPDQDEPFRFEKYTYNMRQDAYKKRDNEFRIFTISRSNYELGKISKDVTISDNDIKKMKENINFESRLLWESLMDDNDKLVFSSKKTKEERHEFIDDINKKLQQNRSTSTLRFLSLEPRNMQN